VNEILKNSIEPKREKNFQIFYKIFLSPTFSLLITSFVVVVSRIDGDGRLIISGKCDVESTRRFVVVLEILFIVGVAIFVYAYE
jgi:hypothetical protein